MLGVVPSGDQMSDIYNNIILTVSVPCYVLNYTTVGGRLG